MKLILINHNEEYAAREMITSHIPKLKIEIAEIIPESGDYLISELLHKENEVQYNTTLVLNEKTYTYSHIATEHSKIHIKKAVNEVMKKALGTYLPWGLITGIRPSKIAREMSAEGYNDAEIYEKFKNYYECSEQKTDLAMKVSKREKHLIDSIPKNSVSLYIGIPFCPTRCLYCSFTSQSIKFSNKLTEPYMDALCKEIEYTANLLKYKGLLIDTIYIGGGTPTALNESQLNRLLDKIHTQFDISNVREFTLEAGRPDTITEEKLKIIQSFGISRISINPQTMNQKTLNIIGRNHTPDDILNTYNMAVRMGFGHINTDIIAGLPDENEDDFLNTLKHIKAMNPQSVTVHTMSIKRGSYLDEKYSLYTPSAFETVNNMLTYANKMLASMGKVPYYMYRQKNMLGNLENVGYCDEGHECLYNIYIMEEVQDIYALGAGASTKIITGDKINRIFNVKEVSEYINRIDEMILRKKIFET